MNIKGYQTLHQMQIKVKQWRFYCCYTSYSHNSVFNNEHTKSYPKMIAPPLPACSRAVFSTVSMSTNVTFGHPYHFDMYATRFINKKTKHRRMQFHTAITGSDTTPWGNKHRNHWVRHHTMRQQTPRSLGQTPHHEATNAAITGSDTTPWSHKRR